MLRINFDQLYSISARLCASVHLIDTETPAAVDQVWLPLGFHRILNVFVVPLIGHTVSIYPEILSISAELS